MTENSATPGASAEHAPGELSVEHGQGASTSGETGGGPGPERVRTQVPALGVEVHARVWGGGIGAGWRTPLVLVHGLGLSSRYFAPLGRRLAALGHRVLAPDLPGFGRTRPVVGAERPAGPDVRSQAEHLIAWMDATGLQRAVLFGNSVGVQVALEVATRFPERVERLVLEGPTPDPAYRSPVKQYARVLRNMLFEPPSLNSVYQADYASARGVRVFAQLARTVDDPIEERLPLVQAPTLVVRGRHDQTLSQEWAERVTGMLPQGRLVVVEGAAHNVHYAAPHIAARLIHTFLISELDGAEVSGAAADGVVVPADRAHRDPLAPRLPISTRTHGLLDYATAAVCVSVPTLLGWGPRTRALWAGVAVSASAYSLLTDYERGVLRKIPMPVHLNIDAGTGMQLVLAAATVLRGEPAAGRWATAALGLYEIAVANATQKPAGPAHLVPLPAQVSTDPAAR
ncbi:alpha/beta fold hydrolase [Kineococcus sp. G2]|uniref:alpha/beta fold hydrolase n=1 Tax=Kineococcus sp. G2 TaxID=3127484 RepID=UPI00301D4C69